MTTEISTNTAPARGLALASFDDAWRFWQMVAKTEFAPKDFRGKPEACLLAGQHAAELGLGPMQGLQCIAVINGRPSIWGDAALALVQSSAVCEWVTEKVTGDGDAMVATCEAKRRGYPQPTTVAFSVADAKKAGLWGKAGPWTQYPRRMLQLRARGFALRDAFPDVLKGLVTAEEAQDYATHEPAPARPTATPAGNGIEVHHVASFEPPEKATAEDMAKARRAIAAAKAVDRLRQIHATVSERIAADFYTPAEASELIELIDTRVDLLSPRGDAYEGDLVAEART
jgi:hypothetical protein